MPGEQGGPEPDDPTDRGRPPRRRPAVPRLPVPWLILVVALAGFALLGWQGASTVGRSGPLDAAAYLLDAQYLDAHGRLVPAYIGYEYSSPPLFETLAVGLERVVRAAPAWPLELSSNVATRLLWLLLVAVSAGCLISARTGLRLVGAAGLVLGTLWGLDEAVALARSQTWSAGQLLALVAAVGLVAVSALIARELWPDRPYRILGTAAFVIAYPVVLRLGVLFHPETTLAFLAALATLVLIRAGRSDWPRRSGLLAGALCGLGLLTRQSALVLILCVVATALLAGRRRARGFTIAAVAACALLAGPWLGYAAATWGNPLQGNLQEQGNMVAGGEPLSFYVSFPFGSIVTHPYRPHLANELLPQLHADLWSDWFGAFHQPAWSDPSTVDRVTASSQSVLGLLADALAIGGLVAIGLPALRRAARGAEPAGNDTALGFLALLAMTAFVALAAQIVRYPQIGGKEIKASYLLFTAPAWAVFSVAAWVAVARRRPIVKVALAAAALLYAVSYGTSLAATFSRTYPTLRNAVVPAVYVDLKTSIQQLSPTPHEGGEANLTVWVANDGTGTAHGIVLQIALARGMKLLGPPSYERGSGCVGTRKLECSLDFLEPGMSTPIRFAVQVTSSGFQQVVASVSSSELDSHPADNRATLTMVVGPYS